MKLYLSTLAAASLAATYAAAEPAPSPSVRTLGTQIPTDWRYNGPGTQIPTAFDDHGPGTQIPTADWHYNRPTYRPVRPTAHPTDKTGVPTPTSVITQQTEVPSVSSEPTLLPSTSTIPTLFPSITPSISVPPTQECGPDIDNFTKMGKGFCRDGNGNPHDMIRFNGVATAEECATNCECLVTKSSMTLQGFDHSVPLNRCRCRVDDDSPPSTNECGWSGPNVFGNTGAGKVIDASGGQSQNYCCFRYDLTSSVPSESPSRSLTPTGEQGSDIDGYTYMGKGKCEDGNGDFYNFFLFDGVTTGADCADECARVAQYLTVQGFDLQENTDQCRCRVDEDNTSDAWRDARVALDEDDRNSGKGGTGTIISANGNQNFFCFRNDQTSTAPSVSPAPSRSFQPSLSSVPSISPVPSPAPTVSDAPSRGRGRKTGQTCNSDIDCRSRCCGDVEDTGTNVCIKLNSKPYGTCPDSNPP